MNTIKTTIRSKNVPAWHKWINLSIIIIAIITLILEIIGIKRHYSFKFTLNDKNNIPMQITMNIGHIILPYIGLFFSISVIFMGLYEFFVLYNRNSNLSVIVLGVSSIFILIGIILSI